MHAFLNLVSLVQCIPAGVMLDQDSNPYLLKITAFLTHKFRQISSHNHQSRPRLDNDVGSAGSRNVWRRVCNQTPDLICALFQVLKRAIYLTNMDYLFLTSTSTAIAPPVGRGKGL